ncbi:Ap4A phosphorylase II [Drepanopeziza brunnea f. sp. 'multigermtubi' MB_m1]|uniref:Ap4A phosphorylase II n=1 Tax=Marssonina brunnea f. sp. multigermtubi (strain MB_m1) TaxID=1072389 RepID=K1WAT9_MARBU|nr:Ap4A phosphorylase II [Drepanopeziza brunnea f. sp. 'multigermtubi' MB_m1]EKD14400.1 Ap4A phosphorylase II [Drepanopeziza brunnea f. sp. 'multigermtubi' MB_m1]
MDAAAAAVARKEEEEEEEEEQEEESLEQRSLRQFDALVERGQLLWRDTTPQLIAGEPFNASFLSHLFCFPCHITSADHRKLRSPRVEFPHTDASPCTQFQFRSAASLTAKPILPRDDPARSKPTTNPFADEDPDFLLARLGPGPGPGPSPSHSHSPSHSLILNKYCVVRPQYLLHTNDFVPQADPLTEADLGCAWDVLQRLESGRSTGTGTGTGSRRYLVIYNCGFEAGSSLGHKHLQILPAPPREEFDFFPDALGIDDGTGSPPSLSLPASPSPSPSSTTTTTTAAAAAALLAATYAQLLRRARVAQAAGHNVLLVREWMLVIPRSRGRKGILSANAAAMAGMVWVTGPEEVRLWQEEGPMNLLCEFGVAVEEDAEGGHNHHS